MKFPTNLKLFWYVREAGGEGESNFLLATVISELVTNHVRMGCGYEYALELTAQKRKREIGRRRKMR